MLRRIFKAAADYVAAVRDPVPPSETTLFRFKSEKDVARWRVFTDQEFGGRSVASLELSSQDQVLQADLQCRGGSAMLKVACSKSLTGKLSRQPSTYLCSISLLERPTGDVGATGNVLAIQATAVFSGTLSREVSRADTRLQRSGFCGIVAEVWCPLSPNSTASQDVQPAGRFWDLEPFTTLVIRARGDGRRYLATLRTDDWIVGQASQDRWQAFLFARKGVWQDVAIPLDRFLLTWRGRLVETKSEMNARSVSSIGISLAGSDTGEAAQPAGPFSLELQCIRAERSDGLMDQRQS